jgi:predicted DNA-binding helix-hairpin-helix protein
MEYYYRGLVDGCFLSSAICKDPTSSQEKVISTLQIIRKKYKYSGYIHTKILPNTSDDLVYEAAKYSDRLSINLEAPGQNWLSKLSPDKNYAKLIAKLRKISKIAQTKKLKAGVTTQLVVGGSGESDFLIVNLASKLYKEFKLWRVYYSGFIPIEDTPLEKVSPCSPKRELRLYQADALIRKYGFKPEEIPYKNGFLSLEEDPKLVWAKLHPEFFPVEINDASFHKLIRVPGIGKVSAQKIIEARKEGKIKSFSQLERIGIILKRAWNFVTINYKPLRRLNF